MFVFLKIALSGYAFDSNITATSLITFYSYMLLEWTTSSKLLVKYSFKGCGANRWVTNVLFGADVVSFTAKN